MDQQQREAFEAEWSEMSKGIGDLLDSSTLTFIRSVALAAFSAGAVYGCREAYGHAFTVIDPLSKPPRKETAGP